MKTAVLAGIRLEENEQEFKAAMDETASLCHACGIEIVSVITQASRSSDPETAFRKGKFKELCAAAKELDVDLIIFHNSLRIIVAQRISKEAGVNVIDRTALINNVAQVMEDPSIIARNMIVEVEHPVAGKLKVPGIPIKLSETPGEVLTPAPLLAADTNEIMKEFFGWDEATTKAKLGE